MVLEDIEAGSIRVWLSSFLKKIDDQGLREGEIKKAIGPALVEAKYAAIAWLDKDQNQAEGEIDQLRDTLRNLAAASDVRPLGDYPPIQQVKLIAALDTLQDAKRLLGPKDRLLLEAPHREAYEADLTKTWDPAEIIPIEKTTTEQPLRPFLFRFCISHASLAYRFRINVIITDNLVLTTVSYPVRCSHIRERHDHSLPPIQSGPDPEPRSGLPHDGSGSRDGVPEGPLARNRRAAGLLFIAAE